MHDGDQQRRHQDDSDRLSMELASFTPDLNLDDLLSGKSLQPKEEHRSDEPGAPLHTAASSAGAGGRPPPSATAPAAAPRLLRSRFKAPTVQPEDAPAVNELPDAALRQLSCSPGAAAPSTSSRGSGGGPGRTSQEEPHAQPASSSSQRAKHKSAPLKATPAVSMPAAHAQPCAVDGAGSHAAATPHQGAAQQPPRQAASPAARRPDVAPALAESVPAAGSQKATASPAAIDAFMSWMDNPPNSPASGEEAVIGPKPAQLAQRPPWPANSGAVPAGPIPPATAGGVPARRPPPPPAPQAALAGSSSSAAGRAGAVAPTAEAAVAGSSAEVGPGQLNGAGGPARLLPLLPSAWSSAAEGRDGACTELSAAAEGAAAAAGDCVASTRARRSARLSPGALPATAGAHGPPAAATGLQRSAGGGGSGGGNNAALPAIAAGVGADAAASQEDWQLGPMWQGATGASAPAAAPSPAAAWGRRQRHVAGKALGVPRQAFDLDLVDAPPLELQLPEILDLIYETDADPWVGGGGGAAGGAYPTGRRQQQLVPLVLPASTTAGLEEGDDDLEPGAAALPPPGHVDGRNWRAHAAARFPALYDPDWHCSLFELLFDLWPEVGAAAAGGKQRRPQDGALLAAAFEFADLCDASADFSVRAALALSVVDCLEDHPQLPDLFVENLPPLLQAKVLAPLARLLNPAAAEHWVPAIELMLEAAQHQQQQHQPHTAGAGTPGDAPPLPAEVQRGLGKRWKVLLGALQELQAAHPAAQLPVLGALLDLWEAPLAGPEPAPSQQGRQRQQQQPQKKKDRRQHQGQAQGDEPVQRRRQQAPPREAAAVGALRPRGALERQER